ncbi:hypothetical protein MJ1_0096 [Nanobdella aerobiophila]|uniref:Uncharacterized protein n=1 Tax=Nanobdella aerobiophila TaxID=2586965 RepID=A0A915SKE3_9ARCH|nr:hypothetical protein [Nanobdella aerobiophila]BBL45271.1 hypothetical protein MJ1_0096 [Nanobdella aerobiophila]
MIYDLVAYSLLFIAGFVSAEYVTRKTSTEFIIEIKTKTKRYHTKIHHAYLFIAGIISTIYDIYLLALLFFGISIHDIVLELNKRFFKKSK